MTGDENLGMKSADARKASHEAQGKLIPVWPHPVGNWHWEEEDEGLQDPRQAKKCAAGSAKLCTSPSRGHGDFTEGVCGARPWC